MSESEEETKESTEQEEKPGQTTTRVKKERKVQRKPEPVE